MFDIASLPETCYLLGFRDNSVFAYISLTVDSPTMLPQNVSSRFSHPSQWNKPEAMPVCPLAGPDMSRWIHSAHRSLRTLPKLLVSVKSLRLHNSASSAFPLQAPCALLISALACKLTSPHHNLQTSPLRDCDVTSKYQVHASCTIRQLKTAVLWNFLSFMTLQS